MLPTGFANISCIKSGNLQYTSHKNLKYIEVNCGRSRLEKAVSENLYEIGLQFPNGNLIFDRYKREISISRSLTMEENGSSILYFRQYPLQKGIEEIMGAIDRYFRKNPALKGEFWDEDFLSGQFERYLINNTLFNEKVVYKPDSDSKAEIRSNVNFFLAPEHVLPREQQEYSINLNENFIEEINRVYRRNYGKDLSSGRRNVLICKSGALTPKKFLQIVGIQPSRSKCKSAQIYKNIKNCTRYITHLAFR